MLILLTKYKACIASYITTSNMENFVLLCFPNSILKQFPEPSQLFSRLSNYFFQSIIYLQYDSHTFRSFSQKILIILNIEKKLKYMIELNIKKT